MAKNRKAIQIIGEIHQLLDELTRHISSDALSRHGLMRKDRYSGASGGIKMLFEEGFFKETKWLPEVITKLKQEGFNYPHNTVSMALLRSVRQRFLVRLIAEGRKSKEKWVYVIRK